MGVRFNADDLLAIAVGIEQNGVSFYTSASRLVADPIAAKLLADLATWETTHAALFADMRAGLTDREREPTAYDPLDEAALYLQAVADGAVFDLSVDPTVDMGDHPSLEAILRIALAREQASIAFYTTMRDYLPVRLGRERLDAVVKEERGHVAQLAGRLSALRRG
jgi:rubrerythrin